MVDQWTMVDLQNGDVIWLVVWIIFYIFHNIWDVILPIDFHIFQRGWNHQPVIYVGKL